MTSFVRKILEEALALTQGEREELVAALIDSLDDRVGVSPEWEAELARRIARIESGEANMLDAEGHLAELRARYGPHE